jgi:hypothetical protein
MHISVSVCLRARVCACVRGSVCKYTHAHIYEYTHAHAFTHSRIHAHTDTDTDTETEPHTNADTITLTHTHTHTHTHIPACDGTRQSYANLAIASALQLATTRPTVRFSSQGSHELRGENSFFAPCAKRNSAAKTHFSRRVRSARTHQRHVEAVDVAEVAREHLTSPLCILGVPHGASAPSTPRCDHSEYPTV